MISYFGLFCYWKSTYWVKIVIFYQWRILGPVTNFESVSKWISDQNGTPNKLNCFIYLSYSFYYENSRHAYLGFYFEWKSTFYYWPYNQSQFDFDIWLLITINTLIQKLNFRLEGKEKFCSLSGKIGDIFVPPSSVIIIFVNSYFSLFKTGPLLMVTLFQMVARIQHSHTAKSTSDVSIVLWSVGGTVTRLLLLYKLCN